MQWVDRLTPGLNTRTGTMLERYSQYKRLRFETPAAGVLRVIMHNPESLNSADILMHGER